jgi:hypothetical protein
MSIALVQCKCSHEFQDRTYGPGRRVANATQKAKAKDRATVRCTVCSQEHDVNITQLKK